MSGDYTEGRRLGERTPRNVAQEGESIVFGGKTGGTDVVQ